MAGLSGVGHLKAQHKHIKTHKYSYTTQVNTITQTKQAQQNNKQDKCRHKLITQLKYFQV